MNRYNPPCFQTNRRIKVAFYVDIALIIVSIALIASVVLQNKGVGLGGLTGNDTGGVFTQRRGIEKTLFYITIGLSVLFFILTLTAVIITK
jgi:preprotein translocase subunit SecG